MFSQFGLTEILVLLGIVVLLFGAKQIPVVGRALGQGISNFVAAVRGVDDARAQLPGGGETRQDHPPEPGGSA